MFALVRVHPTLHLHSSFGDVRALGGSLRALLLAPAMQARLRHFQLGRDIARQVFPSARSCCTRGQSSDFRELRLPPRLRWPGVLT